MERTYTKEQMLNYLQQMMDDFKKHVEWFGFEDERVQDKLTGMIACKEMVEAFIQEPVNLRSDNYKVTVGF